MNDEIENKKKGNKKVYIIAIVTAIALVVAITATSYAYFVGGVINESTPTATTVTTTSLGIEFTDGAQVTLENAIPGAYVVKTFKVENVGNGDTVYDVYMSDLINDFSDKTDLVYTLTSNDGGANITTQTQVPASSTKIVSNQLLRVGEEHNYTLRVDFKETNDNQDDNKGKTFSTIIRINEVQESKFSLRGNANAVLGQLSEYNLTTNVIDKGETDTFAYDGTTDNNLRYVGADPSNYVRYNNELWRIIGVMNNIQTSSGQTKSLFKIRRAESLGSYSWDYNSANTSNGINQWGASTYENGDPYAGADLMRELNTDYLGNITVATGGKWYLNSSSPTKAAPESSISATAQEMLEEVVWHTRSLNNNNGTFDDASGINNVIQVYTRERTYSGNQLYPNNGQYTNDGVVRTSTWTGKVGLIYPSDYIFATKGGSTTNRDTCLNSTFSNWHQYNPDCDNNDWLKGVMPSYSSQGTMTSDEQWGHTIYVINGQGCLSNTPASGGKELYPAIFLKSTVSITGGTGTQADPYTLG